MTDEQKGTKEVPGYHAYLLRLWREKGRISMQWRASLQDPYSSERVGFAHLDELFAFLRDQTGLAPRAEYLVKDERASETGLPTEEGGSE